jgi:flagellar protein FlaI
VLFQALATGHGGMCTMHAENLDSAIKRLTSKPMDISPAYIPLMNIVLSVQRVHLIKNNERKAYRRILDVNEIANYNDYRTVFKWYPNKDEQTSAFEKSVMLPGISERLGMSKKDLIEEIQKRKVVLHWMREHDIRSYKDVAEIISEYSAKPKQIYEKVLAGEEVKAVAVSRNP